MLGFRNFKGILKKAFETEQNYRSIANILLPITQKLQSPDF